MKMFDNAGNVVGEQSVVITNDGTISTNTTYDRGRPVIQIISVWDKKSGNVRTETVRGGKLLP
jgi:hypothetical protein